VHIHNTINVLFCSYATNDRIGLNEWLHFVRTEQETDDVQIDEARQCFEHAVAGIRDTVGSLSPSLGVREFAVALLSPQNDATTAEPSFPDMWQEPLAHYWTACSHNSYIVGDQLTGRSTADAYQRQLLQRCRQLEIDCWDGPDPKTPVVTHGHTFCTVEAFQEVAKALSECAFVTSELPVVLSMEMHCCPKQQRQITEDLLENLGQELLPYNEFVASSNPVLTSPFDLKRRVLLKGKIKERKESIFKARSFLRLSSRLSSRICLHRASSFLSEAGEEERFSTAAMEHSKASEAMASADNKRKKSSKIETDELYASYLSLRSVPASSFLVEGASRKWPLPITSIEESKLFAALGLTLAERNEIEGLRFQGSSLASVEGLTEQQLSSRAIARLAANPPGEVAKIQHRTRDWLLRPYPLGFRFSGKNMSPLPCWLAGAQSVALNMSNNDLAIQLHFALFDNLAGYKLKPPEMVGGAHEESEDVDNVDACWPPPRAHLHRASLKLLSLHNLPKRQEQRPRFNGSRGRCHDYVSELSGNHTPPNRLFPSSPSLQFSVHPIGGFTAVSRTLPLPQSVQFEASTATIQGNGMNAIFSEDETVHFFAAEPHATFLRVGVIDSKQEVAYETLVLGRLRCGFRVIQLRSPLGTRIELCYLFVKINTAQDANTHMKVTKLSSAEREQYRAEIKHLQAQIERLSVKETHI